MVIQMIYKVPYGLDVSVSIETVGDSKHVRVICPMYMAKEFMLEHSYSADFTDNQILKDYSFSNKMCQHFPERA